VRPAGRWQDGSLPFLSRLNRTDDRVGGRGRRLPAVIQRVSFRVSRREDDRFDANRFYFNGQVFVLQDVGYHGMMSRVHYVVVVVIVVVVGNAAAGFNHLNIFVFEHAEINLN